MTEEELRALIINQCRHLDKDDVYEWLASDEIILRVLDKRINKALEFIDSQSPDAGVSGKHITSILVGELDE